MANPPHLFRVDGRLDELVLRIRPWSDDVVDKLGFDPRSSYVEETRWASWAPRPRGCSAGWRPASSTARTGWALTWPRRPGHLGSGTAAVRTPPLSGPSTAPCSSGWLRSPGRGAVCTPTAPAAQPRPIVAALAGLAGPPRRLASRAHGELYPARITRRRQNS